MVVLLSTASLALGADGEWAKIGPGEQHWYTLAYAGGQQPIEIGMGVRPAAGASFQIVTADAVRAWSQGAELVATGRSTRDQFSTADLTWTGGFYDRGTYHLLVEYSGDGQAASYYSLDVRGASVVSEAGGAGTADADAASGAATEEAKPAASPLATASAVTRLSNQPGRAIVTARGNHFVIDSVPPLGGPNEERNPLDLALGALGTCGTFIYETAAQEKGISLTDMSATVEGDFTPAGVKDGSVNPRIQAFRVRMEISGATAEEAEALSAEFQKRCPIYTTLSRSAPIEIENVTDWCSEVCGLGNGSCT